MIKKLTLSLLISWFWLMISLAVFAQSHAPELIDKRDQRERSKKRDSGNEADMKSDFGLASPNDPVRIDPSDPAGVTTNTPRPRIPSPSGKPGNQH
ncbi:hypothetical protein ABF87_03600 [Nitrosomonas sp. JL21]|uniref:hypothetical protein n=1 Tax=Nitrosomonas sp. JL21 TaxID=153949 RepID=UPI00136F026A|nr:hypothetical protein [Nitrosomonas sp. JL21]MBL8498535.1 hypothetical protein [Nitrosomonas sp.]MXS77056.1 hypothetical protein [Nitrosomonas sp. JL21]